MLHSESDPVVSSSVFVRGTVDKFSACMFSNTMDCFHGEVTLICAWFHDTFVVIHFSCGAEDVTSERSHLNLYGYHLRYPS